jgi:hypothetical protein
MPEYPIRVPLDPYRGRDEARLRKADSFNRAAERIERFLNDQVGSEKPGNYIFSCGRIAIDLKMEEKTVENVLFGIGGGNGITIVKR